MDLCAQRFLELETHVRQIFFAKRKIMELALIHVREGVFVIYGSVVEVAVDVVASPLVDYS